MTLKKVIHAVKFPTWFWPSFAFC